MQTQYPTVPADAYRTRRERIRAAALAARERDRKAADAIRQSLRGPVPAVLAELLGESVR